MNKIDIVFKAENEALQAMVDSMTKGIEQAKGWEGKSTGIMVVTCPHAAESLAMIGAGQTDLSRANTETLIAITGDLGHDVAFGLYNETADTKVVRRTVHQPITLAKGVTWTDITNVMGVAIEYMEERIRLNSKTLPK